MALKYRISTLGYGTKNIARGYDKLFSSFNFMTL